MELADMPAVQTIDSSGEGPVSRQVQQLSDALASTAATLVVGTITEVNGGKARCALERGIIRQAQASSDSVVQMTGQVGSYLKVRVNDGWIFANVKAMRLESESSFGVADDSSDIIMADVDFVGEAGDDGNFRRGVTHYPSPGDRLATVTHADLMAVFSPAGLPHINIGHVYPTKTIPAALLIDSLLSRHFALLGSTGTGKSTMVSLLLHRIIRFARHGHIIMLDPHGEYGRSFETIGNIFDTSNLEIPYWAMNLEEHVEVFIGKRVAESEVEVEILARCLLVARSKSRTANDIGRITVDSPIPYLLSDLLAAIQTQMGKLEKPEKVAPYLKLKHRIEEVKADPRYAFMFSGLLVSDTISDFIRRMFALNNEGRPISIIDLSGVPSDIVNVVVAVLARLVFDFSVWSRGDGQRPLLFICEEAHRYVPNERIDLHNAASKVLGRIAKEGRKYGVSLGLVSQRPSDLSESVLSQCGTILSLRMNNERDQSFVRDAMPEGARGFLDALPALRNRECIISGEGVPIPMRVTIDDLEPALRPASDDPQFSSLWSAALTDHQMVDRIVRKWRLQGR